MKSDEYYTAILSVKHVYREIKQVTRGFEKTDRLIDHEVGKVVIRAESLEKLKEKIKSHVEIL